MSKNAETSQEYFDLTGKHYETDIEANSCSLCGCMIQYKTASFESECGASYYNSEHGFDLPVRWGPYEEQK